MSVRYESTESLTYALELAIANGSWHRASIIADELLNRKFPGRWP